MAKIINMSDDLEQDYNRFERKIKKSWRIVWFSVAGCILLPPLMVLLIPFIMYQAIVNNKYRSKALIIKSGLEGEKRVNSTLENLSNDYTVINGLKIVSSDGRRSEIDSVVIGNGNLFILEVKNYKGYIYGDPSQNEWSQETTSTGGQVYKKKIRNTIKQSTRQLHILKDILNSKGLNPYIKQLIVFSNEELDFDIDNSRIPLLTTEEVIFHIENEKNNRLSKDEEVKIIEHLAS